MIQYSCKACQCLGDDEEWRNSGCPKHSCDENCIYFKCGDCKDTGAINVGGSVILCQKCSKDKKEYL